MVGLLLELTAPSERLWIVGQPAAVVMHDVRIAVGVADVAPVAANKTAHRIELVDMGRAADSIPTY